MLGPFLVGPVVLLINECRNDDGDYLGSLTGGFLIPLWQPFSNLYDAVREVLGKYRPGPAVTGHH